MTDLDTQNFLGADVAALGASSLISLHHVDVLARDLSLGLGAVSTILATGGAGNFTVIGAYGDVRSDDEFYAALTDFSDIEKGAVLRGALRWQRTTMGGQAVEFFAETLHPAGSEDVLMLCLFDPPIEAGKRDDIEARYLQRKQLATSYLEISTLNRSRREREFALEKALSTMRTGVVLLDAQANVVFSNDIANSIFETADCLKTHRGRLSATNLRDNVRLTVALQHVAALGEQREIEGRVPMLALERFDHTVLILLALPIRSSNSASGDAVTILHVVDPKVDFAEHVRPLCRIYRLSRAETDLACLLAKGITLANAAQLLRLKEQTARSSLRSIFFKTGTGRQTDLVLLLLSHMVQTSSTLSVDAF